MRLAAVQVPSGPASVRAGETLMSVQIPGGTQTVDSVRSFVITYLSARFARSLAERVGIACQELLENAEKYGTFSMAALFELRRYPSDLLEVRVTNGSSELRRRQLLERVAELRRSNPEETYRKTLREGMSKGTRSMLGLARVRHEASMDIEVTVDDERVTVIARTRDAWASR